MVAMYNIAGRQVGSHWLAIATLVATFSGSAYALRGDSKPKSATPPLNAGSKDEEKFIQEFMQQIEAEDKSSKKAAH